MSFLTRNRKHTRNGSFLAISLLLTAACGPDRMTELSARLTDRIDETAADTVGVYFYDLATGDLLSLDAGTALHAASMMKVLVMIQAFRDVDANLMSLDDEITITNTFQSVVDGSPYELAGLPAGTKVAHKTGRITRINHDGGIVYTRNGEPYVLVVLTSGIDDPAVSDELIADLSRIVYSTFD